MKKAFFLTAALVGVAVVALVLTTDSRADTLEIRKGQNVAISTVTADAFNGGIWTGWISVADKAAICFDLFHDYTGNAGVTMRCETSQDKTTAADSGFDITVLSIAGGTATSTVLTWSHATGADTRWSWCVEPPGAYINCKFDDTSGNNGSDTLTAEYRLVTP